MKAIRHIILAPALLLGLEGAVGACVTFTEEYRIAGSDAVVDGVAHCSIARGRCRLRATEVVKEDELRRTGSSIYILRFEPGINERLRREDEAAGRITMCLVPWEPRAERIEGRFYLERGGHAYRVRQDSARGGREEEEEEQEDEEEHRVAGVQAICGPGTNAVDAAGEVLKFLGHNMPPLDEAAT
jgi:hypothetical protein